MSAPGDLPRAIRALAVTLSPPTVASVASVLDTVPMGAWSDLERGLRQASASVRYRRAIEELLESWRTTAPHTPPNAVLLALRTCLASDRNTQLALTWSGPTTTALPARRTDEALLQLVREAAESLSVVSFAVHRVRALQRAFCEAITRGVTVRLVLESPEESAGKLTSGGLTAIDESLRERLIVYVWPRERRKTDEAGRIGTLHAKFAIADRKRLFISSANLTDHAFLLNMELGVLIDGATVAIQAHEHVDELIRAGHLQRVTIKAPSKASDG